MSRLDLITATMKQIKFTKNFREETGCNECAEVEAYSPKYLQDIEGDADEFIECSSCEIQSIYQDGFLIETDIEDELVGYYTSNYDYPVCNHIDGVTDNNIGYAKGITAGGVPFEAELIDKDDTLTMVVIIPAIFNDFYEGEEDDVSSNENITAIHCEVKSSDYSVLDIRMADGAMEENTEAVRDYVNFLVNNGIVTFTSDLINGTVLYRVDELGNDLAKILITMREDKEFWAYTDIDLVEFSKKEKGC